MFTKTLLPDTLRAIKLVSKISSVKNAYLAGGTSLALQLGHRMSIDLDFFTQEEIDENVVATNLSQLSEFNETQREWRTVLGTIGKTKFSIFYYKHRLIDTLLPFEGIRLAGKKDIAAMKLQAISGRSTKRDFIDLYLLAKEFTIDKMFDFYEEKYGVLENNLYFILKGMDFFKEADMDKMPEILLPIDWEEVKTYFRQETERIARERLRV